MNIQLPMKIVLGIIGFFVIIAFTQLDLASQQNEENVAPHNQPKSLMYVAAHNSNTSDFTAIVKMADLADSLTSGGPYTVFAPANEAFANMQKGSYAEMMKKENKEQLAGTFKNHIVRGVIEAEDLEDGETLQTLQGHTLTVQIRDDSTFIGDAAIINADMSAKNGLIHVIDGVLFPNEN